MKTDITRFFSLLLLGSLLLTACTQTLRVAQTPPVATGVQPHEITGTYEVTNDFVLATYYVESAGAVIDMHGFVIRELDPSCKWHFGRHDPKNDHIPF